MMYTDVFLTLDAKFKQSFSNKQFSVLEISTISIEKNTAIKSSLQNEEKITKNNGNLKFLCYL